MKNILVTGASGFIGNNIIRFLSANNFKTYGTFRNTEPNFIYSEYIKCDLTKDILNLDNIDSVIHCAAEVDARNINNLVENNILATKNIVKFCEEKKVKQLIYLSSAAVYGETDTIITEESPRINQDYYGVTKFISEGYVQNSNINNIVILRLPRVIGIGCDLRPKWLPNLAYRLMQNEEIMFYNPDKMYNNFLHINDINKFIYELLSKNVTGIFGIASIDSIKIIEIIELMRNELKSISVLIQNKPKKKMEYPFLIDVTKAKSIGFNSMNPDTALINFCKELKRNE